MADPDKNLPSVSAHATLKRKRSDSLSPLSDNSGESYNSDTSLPKNTCDWTEETLDLLGIQLEKHELFHPMTLFKEWVPAVFSLKYTIDDYVEKRARNILEHLKRVNPFTRLNFESVYDIDASFLETGLETISGCSLWTQTMPPLDGEDHWNHLFASFSDMFAEDLKWTISNSNSIMESMYVKMFQDFVGMFGIDCRTVVLTEKQTIGETNVSSTPDALLMDKSKKKLQELAYTMNILAVVEAGRKIVDTANFSPPGLREKLDISLSDERERKKISKDFHLSGNLIGQHVGELLLHLHRSSNRNGILGIILEETYVTFTYFKCSENQFKNIQDRKRNFNNRPSVAFSKKYNYLKSADREELMEPLVKLGLLQRMK